MAYLIRRGLFQHVLSSSSKLYSELGLKCCCNRTTKGFTSSASKTRSYGNGITMEKNHMTNLLTRIPSKHFHLSAYLETEVADTNQVQERYGKESVTVPLPFTKNRDVRHLRNNLSKLSLEQKFGFVISRKGTATNIQLYAQSKEMAENVKNLLLKLIDEKKKELDSRLYQKSVQCPYDERDVPSSVVMGAISINEIKDLAEKSGCTIVPLNYIKPQLFKIYSNDQTKLEEAEKLLRKYLDETLKNLQARVISELPVPDEIPKELDPTLFLPGVLKEFPRENVIVKMKRKEDGAYFKIFADTQKTADTVKERIANSVQEKLKAFQDQYKQVVEIPGHRGKGFWIFLRSVAVKTLKISNPSVSYHFNLREVKSRDPKAACPTKCLVVGDSQEEVQKSAEELKLMMDNYQM